MPQSVNQSKINTNTVINRGLVSLGIFDIIYTTVTFVNVPVETLTIRKSIRKKFTKKAVAHNISSNGVFIIFTHLHTYHACTSLEWFHVKLNLNC